MWNQEDVEAKLEAMKDTLENLALNSSSTGLPKPQFFDGSTPFEAYLRNFNRIATAHGWDPPRCTQVLPLYLAGPAKAIYESLPADKKNTWKNLLEALQEKLSKKTNKEAARRQLQTRKQKPNESLHEYSIIIKDLVGKAFPKSAIPGNPTAEEEEKFRDEIARDYFRLGLIHEIKERILFMEMPPTLEAAVEQAKGVLEIKESLQQETAINALHAETKEVIEKVKEEICSIRRDMNSQQNQRQGGPGSSNQRGRFGSQDWQQNAQRQNFGQRGRGNFQHRGRGRGRGNFQQNNRFQPNQFRGNYQNQGQRQNYHNQYGQQNQRPFPSQSSQQNQGQNRQGNPNFEPIRNRFVNSVSNRSPSPILMPFLAISLILLANFTNANPTFQICPKNAGSIVDMPSERNCTVPNSDTYQNASVLIFLPKIKLKPFPIYKCWKIRSTVCTLHYAVYFHKNMPTNVTEHPPSRKRCEELIWDKRMVQIEENLWTTGHELKYDWAVIGEECKNTTNEFIQKGQAVIAGNKMIMSWGGSFPFIFSGQRIEQTHNETYIWDSTAGEYWETHQKKGPENALIINNEIFVVESLQYAFFKHAVQSFEGARGIPKDAIRAENGAFIQIQEGARLKREVSPNGRIQPGTRPPKIDNRKRVQPQLRSRPTKMEAQRRTSPQSSTIVFSSTTQTPSTSQATTKRIETSILSTVATQTSSPSSFIPSSTTTTSTKASSISTTRRVTPTQWTTTQSQRISESTLQAQRTQTHGYTRPSNAKIESSTANILELIQLRQRLHQLEKLLTTTERVTTLNGDDLRKHDLEKSIGILEKRIQEVEKWTATTTAVTTTVKRTARQDETVREAHENSKLNYLSLKQKQNAEKSDAELWKNQCHFQNRQINLAKSMALTDPTSAARMLYGRKDISATLDKIDPNKWQLAICTPIQADEIIWSRKIEGMCYEGLPVKIGKSIFFVRPGTWDLQNFAKNISCDEEDGISPGNQTSIQGLQPINQLQDRTENEAIIFTKRVLNEGVDPMEETINAFRDKGVIQEMPPNLYSLNPHEAVQSLIAGGEEKLNDFISGVGKVATDAAEKISEEKEKIVEKIEEGKSTWDSIKSAWETAKWLVPTILIGIGILVVCFFMWKFRAWFQLIFTCLRIMGRGLRAAFALFGPKQETKPKAIAPVRRATPSAPTQSLLEEEAYILDYIPRINAVGFNKCNIRVTLNGHPVKALFDCGADLSYGRHSVFQRCGLTALKDSRLPAARAANDSAIEFVGKAQAIIEIGPFTASHIFLVSIDNDCPEEMIIGTDLMEQINLEGHEINLNFVSKEIRIGHEGCPMVAEIHWSQKQPEIRILNNEILDPRSDYHQAANGMAERQNHTLAEMLNTCTQGIDWPEALPMVCLAYNTSVHSEVQQTPFFITHGYDANLPSDMMLRKETDEKFEDMAIFVQEIGKKLRECWSLVTEKLQKAAERMEIKANERKRAIEAPFYPQQLILLKKEAPEFGQHKKFADKFKGPFRIIEVQRPNLLVKSVDKCDNPPFLIHMDKTKPFFGQITLPTRGEEKRKERRYADRNIEESDSESDARPEKEWLATISRGAESDSDDSHSEKYGISTIKVENPLSEFTKWKIILDGKEEEALVAKEKDNTTVGKEKVRPDWKIYSINGEDFAKIIYLDHPEKPDEFVKIVEKNKLRFGVGYMCQICEYVKWTGNDEYTYFVNRRYPGGEKIVFTPHFEIEKEGKLSRPMIGSVVTNIGGGKFGFGGLGKIGIGR